MLVKIAVELTEPEKLTKREKFGRRLGATAGVLKGSPVPRGSVFGTIVGKERQALGKRILNNTSI